VFYRVFSSYQSSQYARRFKAWTPFIVGAALAVPASLVSPTAGVLLAAGGVIVQAIEKCFEPEMRGNEKVFNMLTDLCEDLIDRSQVARLA
jgi:hypothetical protein